MTYGPLDHAFVALLALTGTLPGYRLYRRMVAALTAGDADARARN